MISKLPFHKQEKSFSCVPACLRMVLAGLGVVMSEVDLRQLCDCTIFGTDAFQAVKAGRMLGFPKAMKGNLSFLELDHELQKRLYPIVYVNLLPVDGVDTNPAMAVVAADQYFVSVYDPHVGERSLSRLTFKQAWKMSNGLTILISGNKDD
jgi:ABC-type bacteriocin/lantibiotic exporter with double-glycine peptidase domain